MNWIAVFKELGLPIALVAGLGYFIYKQLWPWIKLQVANARADLKAMHEQFQKERETSQADLKKLVESYDATTNRFLDSLAERDKNLMERELKHEERHKQVVEGLISLSKKIDDVRK